MDVERIQKINTLALNLMKQGLASDKEDATQQAEKIYRSRETEDFKKTNEKVNESKQEATRTSDPSGGKDLPQEQIKDILEQNTKFLVKKIQDFQERIAYMEKELDALKVKMNYAKIASPGEVLTTKEAVQAKNGPVKLGEVTDNNENVPKNHPKSGGFAQGDVSIEKFFYMGK